MSMKIFINSILIYSMLLSSCTTLYNVSLSDIQPGNTNIISYEETDYGVLHLTFPEINLQPKLREQCKNGQVNGIQTTTMHRDFIIFQAYTVKATAYCK